ncbi:unnamed protein product [Adineta ricciae]|uniref:Uncharacterized protein n=2 Tax=Adineta ricciae TaxID=249248 RepID=A0A815QMR8_ADIRI|nr:unnamed protein product [Adineta ricciae]
MPCISQLFTRKWGRKEHHSFCKSPCSATIVLDGHQKATRRVCAIKNSTVPSIDGSIRNIKVGCSATPAYKSKKCQIHSSTEESSSSNNNSNSKSQPSSTRESRIRHYVRGRWGSQKPQFNLRCKTLKSLQYKRILHRTSGIIAAAYNCGFICSLHELFGCESITQFMTMLVT